MSWPTHRLGDLFQIARGGSPRPIDAHLTDSPDGMPWIMIGDTVHGSKYIEATRKRIRATSVDRSRVIHPGAFLLTNSMSFGRPYISRITGCIHDGWLVLEKSREDIDEGYFFHLLSSAAVFRQFERLAAGATVKNLNKELVSRVEVGLPPLGEQRRIGEILDKAEELRAKRRAALAILDELPQAIFVEMFGESKAVQRNWPTVRLGDFCRTGSGGTPSRQSASRYYEGGTIPWVKSGELRESVIYQTEEHITPAALKESSAKLVPRDAILLAMYGATVGRLAILGVPAATNQAVCNIIPDRRKANLEFVFHALQRQVSSMISMAVGGAQPNISQNLIRSLIVHLPPPELQDAFVIRVQGIARTKTAHQSALAELDALSASLKNRAFSGSL